MFVRGDRVRVRGAFRAVLAVLVACGCGADDDPGSSGLDRVIWQPEFVADRFDGASFARAGDEFWLAYAAHAADRGAIHVLRARAAADALPAEVAVFAGVTPSIGWRPDGTPLVVYSGSAPGGGTAILLRRGDRDGTAWSEPDTLFHGRDVRAACDRLVRTRAGLWLYPFYADGADVCLRSADAQTWTAEPLHGWWRDALEPCVVEDPSGGWAGFARCRDRLVRTRSHDGGRTWSRFDTLAVRPRLDPAVAFAVAPSASGVILAWAEMPPDLVLAEPGIGSLRSAVVPWDGAALAPMPVFAWRAGAELAGSAFCDLGARGLLAWCSTRPVRDLGRANAAIVLRAPPAPARIGQPSEPRLADLAAPAAVALDLWAQHTLARPQGSRRLFVECYAMRGLVAAHTALAPWHARGAFLAADAGRGVAQALAFADSLVARQDRRGYWVIGYDAAYLADMATAIGVYAAVTPFAEAAAVQRYTDSARRFVAALEAGGWIAADGGVGAGWRRAAADHDSLALHAPYVVSTALAGIAARAWLFARSGERELAAGARRSLDVTLAAIGSDGSIPDFAAGALTEGSHWSATYVHEGWMAADRDLGGTDTRAALRRALPAHVDWLLRTQNADGTWGNRAAGETTRTVAIGNFLVWYDRRIESRPQVQAAIRRAAGALVDPDRWLEAGLLYHGNQEDAQRALAARTLAALAGGRPVP